MVSKKRELVIRVRVVIEKSVPQDPHLLSLCKAHDASDPRDRFFYPTITLMIDYKNLS